MYVVIFTGGLMNLINNTDKLNNLEPSIKFTDELESNNSLPFF